MPPSSKYQRTRQAQADGTAFGIPIGTNERSATTGRSTGREVNQYGRPMGGGTVDDQRRAAFSANFFDSPHPPIQSTGGAFRPSAEAIRAATASVTPAQRAADMALGRQFGGAGAASGGRVTAIESGSPGAGIARPGQQDFKSPYGTASVYYPAPAQPTPNIAAAKNRFDITPEQKAAGPYVQPTPTPASPIAAASPTAPVSPTPVPAPVDRATAAGNAVGSSVSALNPFGAPVQNFAKRVVGAVNRFGQASGIGVSPSTASAFGNTAQRVMSNVSDFANRAADWVQGIPPTKPPDFPPEDQPGGRPGGTGIATGTAPPPRIAGDRPMQRPHGFLRPENQPVDFPPDGEPGGRVGGTGNFTVRSPIVDDEEERRRKAASMAGGAFAGPQ